jgi:hypothetical protein
MKEKVFITHDMSDNLIWIWLKPRVGNWSPQKMPDCDIINWQREDIENTHAYTKEDFKKKFNISIRKNSKICTHIDKKLLDNEDYKLFSDDKDRKK